MLYWWLNKRSRRSSPIQTLDDLFVVEHAIRRVKIFRRVAAVTRFRIRERRSQVLDTAITLANLTQILRHPVPA